MKVYEATVIDKCAGKEPVSFESHVVVMNKTEWEKYDVYAMDAETDRYLYEQLQKVGLADEDIHYYFTEDEFKPVDGEIETEEFKYLIGERVA